MTNASDLHVVFGATGAAGRATVRALVAQGLPVRAVSRKPAGFPDGVETTAADAADAEATRHAAEGAAVIYNCVNAPYTQWPELFPPLWRNVTAAAEATGARLVIMDNLYMYGPTDSPLTEDTPMRASGKKGTVRIAMTQELLATAARANIPLAIGRAADFYGPDVTVALVGADAFRNALAGKKVSGAGSLDVPHTTSYIDDVGRALTVLGQRDEAVGQIWHLPAAPPITQREFIGLMFQEANQPPKIGRITGLAMRVASLFNPMARELGEIAYQYEKPFMMDTAKFQQAFGASATPHRDGIRQTLDWVRGGGNGWGELAWDGCVDRAGPWLLTPAT